MLRKMLLAKIHRATVTQADLNYIGSITIDRALMDAAQLYENEYVEIYNINNGSRFGTYVIPGEENSGVICLNGAAARLVQTGDKIIIVNYGYLSQSELEAHEPIILQMDEYNRIQ